MFNVNKITLFMKKSFQNTFHTDSLQMFYINSSLQQFIQWMHFQSESCAVNQSHKGLFFFCFVVIIPPSNLNLHERAAEGLCTLGQNQVMSEVEEACNTVLKGREHQYWSSMCCAYQYASHWHTVRFKQCWKSCCGNTLNRECTYNTTRLLLSQPNYAWKPLMEIYDAPVEAYHNI